MYAKAYLDFTKAVQLRTASNEAIESNKVI